MNFFRITGAVKNYISHVAAGQEYEDAIVAMVHAGDRGGYEASQAGAL